MESFNSAVSFSNYNISSSLSFLLPNITFFLDAPPFFGGLRVVFGAFLAALALVFVPEVCFVILFVGFTFSSEKLFISPSCSELGLWSKPRASSSASAMSSCWMGSSSSSSSCGSEPFCFCWTRLALKVWDILCRKSGFYANSFIIGSSSSSSLFSSSCFCVWAACWKTSSSSALLLFYTAFSTGFSKKLALLFAVCWKSVSCWFVWVGVFQASMTFIDWGFESSSFPPLGVTMDAGAHFLRYLRPALGPKSPLPLMMLALWSSPPSSGLPPRSSVVFAWWNSMSSSDSFASSAIAFVGLPFCKSENLLIDWTVLLFDLDSGGTKVAVLLGSFWFGGLLGLLSLGAANVSALLSSASGLSWSSSAKSSWSISEKSLGLCLVRKSFGWAPPVFGLFWFCVMYGFVNDASSEPS